MNTNETPETLLTRLCHSANLKKLTITLAFAGIVVCFIFSIFWLHPVQNFFSFINADNLLNRIQSLPSPRLGLFILAFAVCCLFARHIGSFFENAKYKKLIIFFSAGATVMLLIFTGVFSYKYGWQWVSSDEAAEMILGKLLADENSFMSRNWYYSTEIRIINQTPIFIMPLFKLLGRFNNWALIRSFSVLLNNASLILSYLFMAKQMKIPVKWICITIILLITPLSRDYWFIVIFGGHYSFVIVQLFCCIGLYIKLASHPGTVKAILPGFIVFTVLSFLLGVQGIRFLLCVHIPLLITSVFLWAKNKTNKFSLFLGSYGFILCCAGFAVNSRLHFWYRFHSYNGIRLENLLQNLFPKFGESLVRLAEFFGFSSGDLLLSTRGIFSVAAIIATVIFFGSAIRLFRRITSKNNTADKSLNTLFPVTFFIASVAFNLFVFIFTGENVTGRYFIPFLILYIPLLAILFDYAEKTYGYLKRVTVIFCILLFVFGQGYLNYKNLSSTVINNNVQRKDYIQYLLDNKLEYGFASFWNANVTTELSDGKIELAGLEPNSFSLNSNAGLRIFGWLSLIKYSDPSYYQGETFLLLTCAEWETARKTRETFAQLQPDYIDDNFVIKRFDSARTVYMEILDR